MHNISIPLNITESMRVSRTVLVHGISTVGKSYVNKSQDMKDALFNAGIDMWDTDELPKFMFGSFRAVQRFQGPVDPERSDACAAAFGELLIRRLKYVNHESSIMLVFTNNISIVEHYRDLVLCSFDRSREDVIQYRMAREHLDRPTVERLMRNWCFNLPLRLRVPAIHLKQGEYLGDYLGGILNVIKQV